MIYVCFHEAAHHRLMHSKCRSIKKEDKEFEADKLATYALFKLGYGNIAYKFSQLSWDKKEKEKLREIVPEVMKRYPAPPADYKMIVKSIFCPDNNLHYLPILLISAGFFLIGEKKYIPSSLVCLPIYSYCISNKLINNFEKRLIIERYDLESDKIPSNQFIRERINMQPQITWFQRLIHRFKYLIFKYEMRVQCKNNILFRNSRKFV
jgi:hypothetical protein